MNLINEDAGNLTPVNPFDSTPAATSDVEPSDDDDATPPMSIATRTPALAPTAVVASVPKRAPMSALEHLNALKSRTAPTKSSDPSRDEAAEIIRQLAPAPTATATPASQTNVAREPSHTPAVFLDLPEGAYNPRKRVSRADHVLRPISKAEFELMTALSLRNPLRTSHAIGVEEPSWYKRYKPAAKNGMDATESPVLTKRKAVEPAAAAESDTNKRRKEVEPEPVASADAQIVAHHYNVRPNVGVHARDESPIIGLKRFNNWIKSTLMAMFALPHSEQIAEAKQPGRWGLKVLELGCGKGGDLHKWDKLHTQQLVGIDVASMSIEQAQSRYRGMKRCKVKAQFYAADCFSNSLSSIVEPEVLAQPFDLVSMQFSMHYAFQSASKARMMLENVSRYLKPGGHFIGTVPNADILRERLEAIPEDAEALAFGNEYYRIEFDSRTGPAFGFRYTYFLLDAVEDVPEFLVDWEQFEQLAAEYSLKTVYRAEFHELFESNQHDKRGAESLQRMRVVNDQGQSDMTLELWEAANIYWAFAMQKEEST
ncbi:uncharacterized protein L969DRAFT_93117 [Mixia osmundae IAM 14324]|uniref:mRNA cap guanine-N(7) methyltransferase n=1 Tax=Mixia osmundae (strain CBS 9802 / IAM 14324 / JCM 22182 / KY 12970) TaxID=764103 RepID=G7E622_MIXOS|nr:uncharacterized protein L969DRAFT_93117 [Mixia osmundae IAM 14324]KEI40568.1 hypothetical protein L969DRAFT_93117 [Mixia osmundae IAM 14324]GAA98282.1 hypothetical protein E5Q_04965 [Mixia osmundae IAM 14324]